MRAITRMMTKKTSMNEAEWLAGSGPPSMLEFLRDKASERKLRLFACACCRRIWYLLKDKRSQQAVEFVEKCVDGLANSEELVVISDAANDVWNDAAYGRSPFFSDAETDAADAACSTADPQDGMSAALHASHCAAYAASWSSSGRQIIQKQASAEQAVQCLLLRDLFGNPFRPVCLDPAWLSWREGAIPKLAQAVYDERAFDRLPILADALEDAGCDNADILNHCRQPGEHVRGCWVVDLLLGKE
jgi:hypothetical protein